MEEEEESTFWRERAKMMAAIPSSSSPPTYVIIRQLYPGKRSAGVSILRLPCLHPRGIENDVRMRRRAFYILLHIVEIFRAVYVWKKKVCPCNVNVISASFLGVLKTREPAVFFLGNMTLQFVSLSTCFVHSVNFYGPLDSSINGEKVS